MKQIDWVVLVTLMACCGIAGAFYGSILWWVSG